MIDAVTPAVERALAAARELAAQSRTKTMSPRHLLVGLLAETDGHAMRLARECGLDVPRWQAQCPMSIVEGEAELADRTLVKAKRLAREFLVDRTVSSDLLFLAIVQTDGGLATELSQFGFQRAQLDELILEPMRTPVALADNPKNVPSAGFGFVNRILDANADRAREALRVLEDYARFGLGDAILSKLVKDLRHELAAIFSDAVGQRLLAARDTVGDVGTVIESPSEYSRNQPRAVLSANIKRLQEALRSLEEYGKLTNTDWAKRIEQLRYRSYSIEQAFLLRCDAGSQIANARLCFLVSASQCCGPIEETVAKAIAGGVDIVQLREKAESDRTILMRATLLAKICRDRGVLFIVNDRTDIASAANADGVHLGQDDLAVRHARNLLQPDALIGVSTHTIEHVQQAVNDAASYIGIGPVYRSATKDFGSFPGLDFVREATRMTSIPAFALGGIGPLNVAAVVVAGASRVAVSSAIASADDPEAVARAIRAALP